MVEWKQVKEKGGKLSKPYARIVKSGERGRLLFIPKTAFWENASYCNLFVSSDGMQLRIVASDVPSVFFISCKKKGSAANSVAASRLQFPLGTRFSVEADGPHAIILTIMDDTNED